MKKKFEKQLYAYIERVKHPDEQILAMEKEYIGWGEWIVNVVLALCLTAFCIALFLLVMPLSILHFLLSVSFFIFLFFHVLRHLPKMLLHANFLVITDKAVYYCTGPLATNVYVWSLSEIVMVGCKKRKLCIISRHGTTGLWDVRSAKTAANDWRNLFSAWTGKPLQYQWFSLTQYFTYMRGPGRKQRYIGEYPYCLRLYFGVRQTSAVRKALAVIVKKNPHFRVEYDGRPIE